MFPTRLKRIHLLSLALIIGHTLLGLNSASASDEVTFKTVAGHPPVPKLKLSTMNGKTVGLENLRGKVVLVNFWATWCIPCRREIPSLQRLWQQLEKSQLQIIAVDIGEDEAAVNNFLGTLDNPPTFPIALDKDSAVLQTWPIKAMPTTFLIDKQGHMAYQATGGLEFDNPANIRVIQALIARDG